MANTSNIKFYDLNYWDAETLEASSEATNWDKTKTQERWKTWSWRTTALTSQYIRITGGSSIASAGFFVFQTNITAGGTLYVKGSDDNWGTTPFSQAMTRYVDADTGFNLFVYIPPSPVNYDDFGFYADDAGNPDGYIELGRIWLGAYFEPTFGYSPRVKQEYIPHDLVSVSGDGQKTVFKKTPHYVFEFPFDEIGNPTVGVQDKLRLDLMFSRVGLSRELVILKKPKGSSGLTYPYPEKNSYYISFTKKTIIPIAGDTFRVVLKAEEER